MRFLQIFTALILFVGAMPVWAQSQSTFKRTTATVLFSSISGGVLGLSTLSFYGKPQEHTDNITTGVLVGFLAGVSYVMYDNYTQPMALENEVKPSQTVFKEFLAQNKRGPAISWPLFTFQYQW